MCLTTETRLTAPQGKKVKSPTQGSFPRSPNFNSRYKHHNEANVHDSHQTTGAPNSSKRMSGARSRSKLSPPSCAPTDCATLRATQKSDFDPTVGGYQKTKTNKRRSLHPSPSYNSSILPTLSLAEAPCTAAFTARARERLGCDVPDLSLNNPSHRRTTQSFRSVS